MRAFGVFLIIGGCFWAIGAWNMDTSVETGGTTIGSGQFSTYIPVSRVHNIGLVQRQTNHLIFSGITILAGIVLVGFGELANKQASAVQEPTGLRCPQCNGLLEGTPQVCKHCRTELRWLGGEPMTPEDAAVRERAIRKEEQQAAEDGARALALSQEQEAARRKAAAERRAKRTEAASAAGQTIVSCCRWVDGGLKTFAGDDVFFYRFVQVMVYLILPAIATIVFVLLRR